MKYKVGDKVIVKNGLGVTQDNKKCLYSGVVVIDCVVNGYYYSESTPIKELLFNDIMIDHEATAELKGGQEMTKSDLKDGMVVENRKKERRLVMGDRLNTFSKGTFIDNYNEDLSSIIDKEYDILKIYKSNTLSIQEVFVDNNLKLLWQRQDKSEAELKLEQLQQQIAEMKAKTAELEQTAEELRREV